MSEKKKPRLSTDEKRSKRHRARMGKKQKSEMTGAKRMGWGFTLSLEDLDLANRRVRVKRAGMNVMRTN